MAQSTRQKLLRGMCQIRVNYQSRISLGTEGDIDTGILGALKARRGLGVTDAKDMVYAHLGMAEAKARSHIPIDYSRSKAQVYEEIARYIYKNSYDFSILGLVENVNLQNRPGLPTWVPDWSVKLEPRSFPAREPVSIRTYAQGSPILPSFELPGVLVAEGRYCGTVVHIPSQALLPSYDEGVPSRQQTLLQWIFKPEDPEMINILLTSCAYSYKQFVDIWEDEPESGRPSMKKEREAIMSNYLECNLGCMSKLVANLPLTTRKLLEEASADPIVLTGFLDQAVACVTSSVRKSIPGNKIVLVQIRQRIRVCRLPAETRVGDFLARNERHWNIFIFRPHEQKVVPEQKAMIRKSLEIELERSKGSPFAIEYCSYIGYTGHGCGVFDVAGGYSLWEEFKESVMFAIH
jgi:hypothetical protein